HLTSIDEERWCSSQPELSAFVQILLHSALMFSAGQALIESARIQPHVFSVCLQVYRVELRRLAVKCVVILPESALIPSTPCRLRCKLCLRMKFFERQILVKYANFTGIFLQ